MGTTTSVDKIFKAFKGNYTAKQHEMPITVSQEFDDETGLVSATTEMQNFEIDADMEALIKSLIKAILDEIARSGLTMGPSEAKKMRVG